MKLLIMHLAMANLNTQTSLSVSLLSIIQNLFVEFLQRQSVKVQVLASLCLSLCPSEYKVLAIG
jgi:hypothetical protein